MTQVNMLEIKDDITKLVNMLETKQEEIIYLTRNGTAVAQMTLIPQKVVDVNETIISRLNQIFDDLVSTWNNM